MSRLSSLRQLKLTSAYRIGPARAYLVYFTQSWILLPSMFVFGTIEGTPNIIMGTRWYPWKKYPGVHGRSHWLPDYWFNKLLYILISGVSLNFKQNREVPRVFEVKSRVKTWQVRGIWSQQLEHQQIPKWGRNQVSGRVSVPCWHATPVANGSMETTHNRWRSSSVSRSWNLVESLIGWEVTVGKWFYHR